MSDATPLQHRQRLRPQDVEKVFTQAVIDLKEILVLGGIDQIPHPPGFRIRCHDLYGPLPDAVVADKGERVEILDKVSIEAAKLLAIVDSRKRIERFFPRCQFLSPTSTDDRKVVGVRIGSRTTLAVAETFWEAYHELEAKVGI